MSVWVSGFEMALLWFRWLAASLLLRRTGFDPRSIHVRFVVDKVTLGQVILWILQFSLVIIIPPILHIHLHLFTTMNSQAWAVIKAHSVGEHIAFAFGCREVKCVNHQLWLTFRHRASSV